MDDKISFGKTELTTDGDSNTYGLIIWLGTKSEQTAMKRARLLEIKMHKALSPLRKKNEKQKTNRPRHNKK